MNKTRISEQISKVKVKKKTNKTKTEKPTKKPNKSDVYCYKQLKNLKTVHLHSSHFFQKVKRVNFFDFGFFDNNLLFIIYHFLL